MTEKMTASDKFFDWAAIIIIALTMIFFFACVVLHRAWYVVAK